MPALSASRPRGGLTNRGLAIQSTIAYRPYTICSGSVCNNGDTYAIQMISEAEIAVEVQGYAGTVVGGTTVNADVRKNGVSILTAPMSFVTKQGVIIQGVIASDALARFGIGDILSVRFTNVGAGSFGQVVVCVKTRPLAGSETRL